MNSRLFIILILTISSFSFSAEVNVRVPLSSMYGCAENKSGFSRIPGLWEGRGPKLQS